MFDFKDHYKTLEISEDASEIEIKKAYIKLAKRWHPDRNKDVDTNKKMQEINEAYILLSDNDARKRYNIEYQKYKKFITKTQIIISSKTNEYNNSFKGKEQYQNTNNEYVCEDEILNSWMKNAKKQAFEMRNKTLEELLGIITSGLVESKNYLTSPIFFIFIIIFLISIIIFSINYHL